jgi:hypothetical protein
MGLKYIYDHFPKIFTQHEEIFGNLNLMYLLYIVLSV